MARAEAVYEGFKRVGEAYVCMSCGMRYASAEETPFVAQKRPNVFTEADRDAAPQVFDASDRQHCCAWCRHMVLNPFGQRCGVMNRFTEATDVCGDFEKRPE